MSNSVNALDVAKATARIVTIPENVESFILKNKFGISLKLWK